jgi:hypothetical protein
VKLASLSGRTTFAPNGSQAAISIEPGSFLTASGEGANAQIRVIDVIARTMTDFIADGTQLATRDATVQELESARGLFEATLAHAAIAVGYSLFSTEAMAEITVTLTKINQSLAAVGLAPVDAPSVGTSKVGPSSDAEVAPAPAGFTGGSMNPANTSGQINSRER